MSVPDPITMDTPVLCVTTYNDERVWICAERTTRNMFDQALITAHFPTERLLGLRLRPNATVHAPPLFAKLLIDAALRDQLWKKTVEHDTYITATWRDPNTIQFDVDGDQ